jgi:hypothetical protein
VPNNNFKIYWHFKFLFTDCPLQCGHIGIGICRIFNGYFDHLAAHWMLLPDVEEEKRKN